MMDSSFCALVAITGAVKADLRTSSSSHSAIRGKEQKPQSPERNQSLRQEKGIPQAQDRFHSLRLMNEKRTMTL